MIAKFCGQCGKALPEGAKFCMNCGWVVESIEPFDLSEKHIHGYSVSDGLKETKYSDKESGHGSYDFKEGKTTDPASSKKKTSRKGLIIGISLGAVFLLLAGLAAGGYFLVRYFKDRSFFELPLSRLNSDMANEMQQDKQYEFLSEDTSADTSTVATEKQGSEVLQSDPNHDNKQNKEDSSSETKIISVSDYIPSPGTKYISRRNYINQEGYDNHEIYAGRLSGLIDVENNNECKYCEGEILCSALSCMDNEPMYIEHYVEIDNEILIVYESSGHSILFEGLWLPKDCVEGTSWQAGEFGMYTIIETGVLITTAGINFENCIARHYYSEYDDYELVEYIAPGYGIVYSLLDGKIDYELLKTDFLNINEANQLMEEFRSK